MRGRPASDPRIKRGVLVTETTTDDNVWYLARDSKQHGPLSHVEMTKLVELGHLRATDLVWRPGFADWRPAPSVFDLAPPAPPPPKPAPPPVAQPLAPEPKPAPAPAPTAQRPQPSFAGLSAAREAAPAAAPARMEFQYSEPAVSPAPRTEGPAPTIGEPKPTTFDTSAFRPASGSHFGVPPASAPEREPEPFRLEPMFEEPSPAKRGRGIGVALGLLLLIGGVSAAGYTYRDTIKAAIQGAGATPPADLPVVQAPVAAPAAEPSPQQTPQPQPVVAAAEPGSSSAELIPGVPVAGGTEANDIDTALQVSPFWSYAKVEFPQWYADRLRDVGDMKAANQPDASIDRKLVEAIVIMRRQNASKALAASPARLKEIAEAFVANLGALQSQSVDACYEFIEKGEMTPAAAAVVQKPVEGPALHAQLRAVFSAVVEGGQSPVTRAAPQPTDYNLLAAELGTIGWSQADIQLFADPKALAAAPRDRVCKMVKDWFSAHLSVKDEPARERLLHETLRLVIAG
jgi:hypothetical protein